MGAAGAAGEFARELHAVYEAAGRPTLQRLVRLGQEQSPAAEVADSTISGWLTGAAVPVKHARYVMAMITYLQLLASKNAGYQPRPEGWWQQLLRAAQEERLAARRAGRPRKAAGPGRAADVPGSATLPGAVLLGPGGCVPRIAELSLRELGVHPAARPGPQAAALELAEMPAYVPRDCDAEVEAALAGGGLVILEGRSAAGKSRAAAEAIRRAAPERQLLIPHDGAAAIALAESGQPLRNTVIWLDDLERYAGDGGLDVHILNRLCPPGRTDVVVLATLRSEARRALESRQMPFSASEGSARRLLEAGVTVRVPFTTSDAERDQAEGQRDDPRIARWLDHGGDASLPEFLAAGPAAVRRWLSGRDGAHLVGAALVSAAVDCRRARFDQPVPRDLLDRLYRCYLDPRDVHRSGLPAAAEGMAWATEPVHGASSLLISYADEHYRAFDYLADHAEQDSATPPIPADAWRIILAHATGDDLGAVVAGAMYAAVGAQQIEIADMALIRLGEDAGVDAVAEMVSAMYLLGWGNLEAFTRWLRRFAESGDPTAMGLLGDRLLDGGQDGEGEEWLRRAAEHGDVPAICRRAELLHERGESTQLEHWLHDALANGHATAVTAFAVSLSNQGQDQEAERWFRQAADASDPRAMGIVGTILYERGDSSGAEHWHRLAAERGNTAAMINLGIMHVRSGDLAAAELWLGRAAEAGEPTAAYNLGLLYRQQGGRDDDAERMFREAAEAGDAPAVTALALMLHDRGDLAGVEELLNAAIGKGHADAVTHFATSLAQQGQLADAERWYRAAAQADHAPAMNGLGNICTMRAGSAAGRPWYEKAAERGDTNAMLNLGCLNARAGDVARAREWFQQAAANGDERATQELRDLAES
jgi:TPR repeat protein